MEMRGPGPYRFLALRGVAIALWFTQPRLDDCLPVLCFGISVVHGSAAVRILRRNRTCNEELKKVRNRISEGVDKIWLAEGGSVIRIMESVSGIEMTVLAVVIVKASAVPQTANLQEFRRNFGAASVTKRFGRIIGVQRCRPASRRRLRNA